MCLFIDLIKIVSLIIEKKLVCLKIHHTKRKKTIKNLQQ